MALISCGLLFLLALSTISFAATSIVVGRQVDRRAVYRVGRNILVIERFLQDLGPITLKGSHLVAGSTVLDGNEAFVDDMSSMLGAYVTVFRGDVRIATTIRQGGQRAVGSRLAPGPAHDALFLRRVPFRGPASVLGTSLYAAYNPLFDQHGNLVGAVFIGLPKGRFRNAVTSAQRTIALTSLGILLLAGLSFGAVARPLRREINERQQDLRRLADRLDLAFENMSDGLCLYDSRQRLVAFNGLYAALYGIAPGRISLGMTFAEVLALRKSAGSASSSADADTMLAPLESNPSGRILSETVDGRVIMVQHRRLPDGGWVATHADITLQRRDQERLRFLALHDSLTGLANRVAFNEAISCFLREQTPFTLFLIDLDHFKAANDTFGHAAGDAILREVGARLREQTRSGGVAARLGGDEFALLFDGVSEQAELVSRASVIMSALSETFVFGGSRIKTGASVGVTVVDACPVTIDEVLGQADLALYAAKSSRRGTVEIYRPALAVARQRRDETESEIAAGLTNREFVLHYQPQYAVDTGRLVGFEALVRWNHPSRGLLYPDQFIPVAEEAGLVGPLGAWVIDQACRDAAAWGGEVRVAVNISAVQFSQPLFVAETEAAIRRAGLRPGLFEIEVTETALRDDVPRLASSLGRLRAAGIRVALDDFGTGYSSLLDLRRLPFDCIKIDQAFVGDLEGSPDAALIVGTIIQLARSFRATVIAEGVEAAGQLAQLRALGCDVAQGFYFSRAVPVDKVPALLATRCKSEDDICPAALEATRQVKPGSP